MPDAWTLVTPAGPYELNPSFTAPQYEPGGVSGPGALRRDDRATYQRSGDGLRTPGALTLVGRVWRDDHNHALMVSELNAIRAAVAACTSVTRVNNAGTYTYDRLAGGATPEITPDGLGGWMVRLDLWPGRAEPTFAPRLPGGPIPARGFDWVSTGSTSNPTLAVTVPPGQVGDLILLFVRVHSNQPQTELLTVTPSDTGWVPAGEIVSQGARIILWYKNADASGSYGINVTFNGPSSVRGIVAVARYAQRTVTAVTHRSVSLTDVGGHWPGNAAWTHVDYIGVGTPGGGAAPIETHPMTVQEDVDFVTGLGSERVRLAFTSATGIDASNYVEGVDQYKFGTLSPLSGIGSANVVFGIVVGGT